MSEKVYEATTLLTTAKECVESYKRLKTDIKSLKEAMQGIVNLGDDFQGKGAKNIKAFYKGHMDVADQWLNLIETRIAFFKNVTIPVETKKLDGKTVVYTSFLEGDLKRSNDQAISMVKGQKKALKDIFDQIDDILPLQVFSSEEVMDALHKADQKREKTITAVEQLDKILKEEYTMLDSFIQSVVMSLNQLLASTAQGGEISPMNFNAEAYQSSEVYKLQQQMNEQAVSYVDYKKEEQKNYEAFKRAQAEINKPWYEKGWDTVVNFTGEITGYYDYKRAKDGIDPVTHEKLTAIQRATAAGMAAAGFIPVIGWGGRIIKGGSALYKTARGVRAVDGALKAYESQKAFEALYTVERGIYGLTAANGLSEYIIGKDLLGNELTDEQRKMSLYQSLGILGASALTSRNLGTFYRTGKNIVLHPKNTIQSVRHVFNKDAINTFTKDIYQQVRTRSVSWTEGMKETYRNLLRPKMEPIPQFAGHSYTPEQTVRELFQQAKDQMVKHSQDVSIYFDERLKRWRNTAGQFVKGSGSTVENVKKTPEPKQTINSVKVEGDGGIKGEIVGKGNVNLNNIDEFISGTKTFDDVADDFAKLYSEKVQSNKTWSWNKSFHGGEYLTARQRKLIKEKAIADGLIPEVNVIKVDGMRYGFADFKSAGLVVETRDLPERIWLLSDEEQFKWLDNIIGGRPEGMTWHHTEVPGKMELVPFGIHNITIHNGGRSTGMWADAPR